jgi:hypothetical protein
MGFVTFVILKSECKIAQKKRSFNLGARNLVFKGVCASALRSLRTKGSTINIAANAA